MNVLNRIEKFFRRDLWFQDSATLQGLAAFYIKPLRLIVVAISDFRDGVLSIRATSLVSTTLLSLVPFLAVTFSVLKAFGVPPTIRTAARPRPGTVGGKRLGNRRSHCRIRQQPQSRCPGSSWSGRVVLYHVFTDRQNRRGTHLYLAGARRATSDQKIYRLLERGPGGTRTRLHGLCHHCLGPKSLARANDITNRTRGDRRALDDGPDAVCADLSRVRVFVQVRSSYAGERLVSLGRGSDRPDLVESPSGCCLRLSLPERRATVPSIPVLPS